MAEFAELEESAQKWIESIIQRSFDADQSFAGNLKSGVILCELINAIAPGSVKKIYKGAMVFKQIENISLFLRGCQDLGMPKDDCFQARDLVDELNMGNVLGCLEGLGGLCQAHDIDVPPFGKNKYAKQNKRVWTEEQLRLQKEQDVGTMLTAGSHGTMERIEAQRGGITFGNEFAGAGSGEATMLSVGSKGTMERQQVAKGGITFGNDYAGSGSTEVTMVSSGSKGTMQRQDVSKGGITFGNQYAGHGTGEMTMLSSGSAQTMERAQISKGGAFLICLFC